MIEYVLTRSKRKTLALYIHDGTVEIRAPLKMPQRAIDEFVASKEKWIRSKLAVSKERMSQRESFSLTYGDTVTYRGNEYPIIAGDSGRVGFNGESFSVPPGMTPEQIKQACVHIYRMLAKRVLPDKVYHYAKLMSVAPTAVKINNAKTRWGSCSQKKSINLSWRLIIAEDDVIDFIVVHELAHIKEMNHSERFWAIVQDILPNYNERNKKLRELQKRLICENWD